LRRLALLPLLLFLAAPLARPQAAPSEHLGQLAGSPTMFAVLAAINAAGYDDQIDSPTNHPLRRQLRDYLARQNIPSLGALRRFVRDHKKANPVEELSQYISFSLVSKGAPDFTPAQPNVPQPPEAEALKDLAPLLAAFYREANVASLWQQVQPYYDRALEQYADPVTLAVQQANAYLRHAVNAGSKARFQVFLDLLGAPNQVHTRVYLDQYFVVITPSSDVRLDEIRHHYLHFLSDGLPFRAAENLNKIRSLGDYALASPILEQRYKEDFNLLATECFIKAVEARLTRESGLVDRALREGYVLTPAFFELLPNYEKQESIMRVYFPELVAGIDMRREAQRLDNIPFATEKFVRTTRVVTEVKPPPPAGIAKVLEDAEDLFRAGMIDKAKEGFDRALAEAAEKPAQARAYYGLARVAVMQRDPETADRLFRKALDFEPDAATKAWSLLYIGKLSDSQGEAEPAKDFYRQALAVDGLPDQVKREAEQGLAGAFRRPRREQ
jgi:tetratricopeptide (TPR) repeat protein